MPTRLIQILRHGNTTTYRLRETSQNAIEHYAALSYSWGGDQTFKTTAKTISQYKGKIVAGKLPQSLQDALIVTERLGLKYIWIDSLCIIQDDDSDKSNEIGQMGRVYGCAAVTIAASRARTAWDGFLSERSALGSNLPDLNTEPLGLRGWTFQERVLSNRVLDFSSLRTHSLALHNAYGSFGINPDVISKLVTGQFTPPAMLQSWMRIAEGFSARALSFTADKHPAIAGMAESFGRCLRHQEYFAGLWESAMPPCLLWANADINYENLQPRPPRDQVCAPTWSWAAIGGRIKYDRLYTDAYDDVHFEVQVQDCQVSLVDDKSPYGAVKSGKLRQDIPQAEICCMSQ
ncbi:HET-domain-containing protein [Mytilinidion resinicola]|uniref:HET-domain-containing protein n=1 Tax=Mytilinidion resinicola TaxID=574789 RepID=A0A6A6YJ32_9PEZI|nr:HET-domain-containing protein [Mytilinidion resinicola]KAF2808800.1 HET-domain-containing protein [Mytilinidion resinicola]